MKKYLYLFSLILIFASCNKIEAPFAIDNTTLINTNKKVLIEDYTGHLCPNCPNASRELDAIIDLYGDNIIGMAVHVGKTFARPYPSSQDPKFQYDFRTSWGENWDSFFSISDAGLPKGMINRIGYPNNEHRKGKNEWLALVQSELEKEADVEILISSNINGSNGIITVNIEVLNDLNGSYNLVICLTEDSIINWQKDGQVEEENYVHLFVLRSVLNTDLGEPLNSITTLTTGDDFQRIYSINLNTLEQNNINFSTNSLFQGNGNAGGWIKENMNIIAYIYNTSTYEILQVEEADLIN